MALMTQMPNPGEVPTFDKADRLAKALQHTNVSVQAMADYLGVSRNTVGNYLARRTPIPRASVIAWALKTGVPFKWLETGIADSDDPEGTEITHQYLPPFVQDVDANVPAQFASPDHWVDSAHQLAA